MSDIHVRRIRTVLLRDYEGLIDVSDVKDFPPDQVQSHVLTRCQAAMTLAKVADIQSVKAADAIVDGFGDNGIDAIYFDEVVGIIYVVQSKWVSGGQKSPDLGEVLKFIRGVKDLMAAKFDEFNDRFRVKQADLERALDGPNEFLLMLTYTGTQPLSIHAEQEIKALLEKENDPIPIMSYRVFSQKELYSMISGSLEGASISLEVTLHDWGQVREPYHAVYGQVPAEQIASWYEQHGTRLLARNLRKFRGDTEVNRFIQSTLVSEPEKFWYFNNGITVLCDEIKKKPLGGSNRDVGHFIFEGVSVVNGAQTVGSIAVTVAGGFQRPKEARVLVRFISLENCPTDFATEVTTATNTQNRIERRDFASLDPNHQRLRQELMLDLNLVYAFKSGDEKPLPETGCTIDDATVALACANPDVRLAADAKRNISVLWEDIEKPPYTQIFNEHLTACRLWRCVQVLRVVEARLAQKEIGGSSIRQRAAIHGNRFILHEVFQSLPLDQLDDPELDVESLKVRAREQATFVLDHVEQIVVEHFRESYLNTFFKSRSNCEKLKEYLPPTPPIPATPYLPAKSDPQQPLFHLEE